MRLRQKLYIYKTEWQSINVLQEQPRQMYKMELLFNQNSWSDILINTLFELFKHRFEPRHHQVDILDRRWRPESEQEMEFRYISWRCTETSLWCPECTGHLQSFQQPDCLSRAHQQYLDNSEKIIFLSEGCVILIWKFPNQKSTT